MDKKITVTGAVMILLGIVLGAFAAHGLKDLISEEAIVVFEKGVRYQMYMGLGFFALGLGAGKIHLPLNLPYWIGLFGVLIFSGCIYIYVLTDIKTFAMIIPIGGSLMIVSWLLIIIKIAKQKTKD